MPRRADPTPEQRRLLDAARAAATQRACAERDYIQAILNAVDAGTAQAAIAEAVGVSGEAIRQVLVRRGYTRQPAGWRRPQD